MSKTVVSGQGPVVGEEGRRDGHRVDPITASVILGALENIAVEMGYKLMRMSYSSIIRESEDFGAALVNARGEQLCESKQSTPLQSGPIPGYVRGMLDALAKRGEPIRPGRRHHAQRPVWRRQPRPGCRVWGADFLPGCPRWFLRYHGPSS